MILETMKMYHDTLGEIIVNKTDLQKFVDLGYRTSKKRHSAKTESAEKSKDDVNKEPSKEDMAKRQVKPKE